MFHTILSLFTIVLTEYRIDFLPHKTDEYFLRKRSPYKAWYECFKRFQCLALHEQKESHGEERHIFQTCTLHTYQQHWWTHYHNSGTIKIWRRKVIQNLQNDIWLCGQASESTTFIQLNGVYKLDQTAKNRWHRACETTILVVHKGSVGKESAIS